MDICARCTNVGEGVPNEQEVIVDGVPVCVELPPGATALSKGATLETLTLEKGYYRTSSYSHDVHGCYNEDACVGGSNAENYCAIGYEGPCEYTRTNPRMPPGLLVIAAVQHQISTMKPAYWRSQEYLID